MALVFTKVKDTDRNSNATLYFGNVDPQASEIIMYELFIQFAPVRNLNMPRDRILRTHQGFGFVEFATAEDANYTLKTLAGLLLYGKSLKLKKTEPARIGAGATNLSQVPVGAFTLLRPEYVDVGAHLFVKNLAPLIDEQFLQETFSKFGTLIMAPVLIRDPTSGESSGHAFLVFDDFATSDKVIEIMNGSTLMNARITIEYAYKGSAFGSQQRKVRHGDDIERTLAESAKKNQAISKKRTTKTKPKPKSKNRP